jgi:hypothetical protein
VLPLPSMSVLFGSRDVPVAEQRKRHRSDGPESLGQLGRRLGAIRVQVVQRRRLSLLSQVLPPPQHVVCVSTGDDCADLAGIRVAFGER